MASTFDNISHDFQEMSLENLRSDPECLPPENEDSNVEYKRHLLDISPKRFQRLASQLKHRLVNGSWECIYEIGVEDDGIISGISQELTDISLEHLKKLVEYVSARICSIYTAPIKDNEDLFYTRVLIREENLQYPIDVSIAILGHVNAGKSSLLGTLLTGELDDGRGRSRSFVTNHRHELETGQTSSIGFHLTGFNKEGEIITSQETRRNRSWREITKESQKIISFIDLCGHSKYFKTTITGVTGIKPDYAIMLIESTRGIQGLPKHLGLNSNVKLNRNDRLEMHRNRRGQKSKGEGMTIEHMSLCRDQNIPFFIVITKLDLGLNRPKILEYNVNMVRKVIKKGLGKQWLEINNEDDIYKAVKAFEVTPSGLTSTIPYIQISCKTGHNIDLLRKFLNLLPKRQHYQDLINKPNKASIIEKFQVEGIGTVVHVANQEGTLKTGQKIWIGPDSTGHYKETVAKSMEYKRNKVDSVPPGRLCTICLRNIDSNNLQKGMVILGSKPQLQAIRQFEANIRVKEHSTTICPGYECPLHIDNIRQTVKVVDIYNDSKQLLPKKDGTVLFEFINTPVSISEGTKFVFRENNTKGVGIITKVFIP